MVAVTSRLHLTTDPNGEFAAQAPQVLGFTTRAALREALSQRSDGRLQLDQGKRHEPADEHRTAPSCIEDVLQPGDDHGTYEFGLDLLLDGPGQSLHKQTTH